MSPSCPAHLRKGWCVRSLELPRVMGKVCAGQAAAQPSSEYLGEMSGVSWFILEAETERRKPRWVGKCSSGLLQSSRFTRRQGTFSKITLFSIEAWCRSISLEEICQLPLQVGRDVQGCRSGAELCACEQYPCSGCHPWVTKGMQG